MEHLSVAHGSTGSTVSCTGCGVDWFIEAGAPMVARLDAFADLHFRCGMPRQIVLPTANAVPSQV